MKRKETSEAEHRFAVAWQQARAANPELPPVSREHMFHPERQWRFDFAWPEDKLALEIEGRGRHQTVDGVRKDCEKYNEAARLGWRMLRFPATDKGEALQWVEYVVETLFYGE